MMHKTAAERRQQAADRLIAACTDHELHDRPAVEIAVLTLLRNTPGYAIVRADLFNIATAVLSGYPGEEAPDSLAHAFIQEEMTGVALTELLRADPGVQAAIHAAFAQHVRAWFGDAPGDR